MWAKDLVLSNKSLVLTKHLFGESVVSPNMCLENKSSSFFASGEAMLGSLQGSGNPVLFLSTSVLKGNAFCLCPPNLWLSYTDAWWSPEAWKLTSNMLFMMKLHVVLTLSINSPWVSLNLRQLFILFIFCCAWGGTQGPMHALHALDYWTTPTSLEATLKNIRYFSFCFSVYRAWNVCFCILIF